MQERIRGYATNIQGKWTSLERSQQVRLVITVVALLAMLIVAIVIVTRPTWVEVQRGMTPVALGEARTALEDEGIAVKISDATSTLSVKEEDLDRARALIPTLPGIVATGFQFSDALEASGMTATESVRDQAFAQLTKADMERMLMTIDGVQDAMVNISVPDDTAFAISDTVLPTAAITLRTNGRFDDAKGLSIANLMMACVKNLTLENIEIMDQNANQIYSGSQKSVGGASSQYDIIHQQEMLLDGRVRSYFMSLFDEVKVIPTLMFDFDQSTTSSTTYSPSAADNETSLPSSSRTLKETATNQDTAAEPGVVQNNQTTPTYEVGDGTSGTGSRSQIDQDFDNNIVEEQVVNSGGDLILDESSLAVNCSRFKVYDEETITPEELNNLTWEQFKAQNSVPQPIPDLGNPNNNATNVAPAAGTAAAPIVAGMDLTSFRNALSVATGIPVERIDLIAYEVPVFNDRLVEPIQAGQIIMFIILALLILLLAFGLIRRAQPDEVVEVEPELSVEDLLVSTQLEEEKLTEAERLKEIELNAESEAKRQIEKFVIEKPEAVAQLLRNWLNDEWE